ncbi:MAG: acetylornithine deacetylase/succinyl-diaminopimelate desuccinylase-like protein [Parasphingorhabdus sp.]|jgi:acetylornithine deacetylase/succinyl-diaminopimelate desuccinylase-like protein
MDHSQIQQFADNLWDDSIVPTLQDYIRIPAKSPLFDSSWKEHGYIDAAVALMMDWCEQHPVEGATYEVVQLPERTPTIFIDIPGTLDRTLLLYGHLDKQPEMVGWRDGLGPWLPVIEDDKLYGRGGADDGYAIFASITSILALHEQGLPHANIKILIEASEESGSPDLPAYMDALEDRIGSPDVVICLDSGCGNYDQLWLTTSLRGMMSANLNVEVLTEGVHSGDAGGVVPSSFRVCRQLLDRIEDQHTGQIKLPEFHTDIPAQRSEQVEMSAEIIGEDAFRRFPFADQTQEMGDSTAERILNRTWRPSLEVTGADGIPAIDSAGNVLRPETRLKLSMRLPPTADADKAAAALQETLQQNPPHNAQVSLTDVHAAAGWNAPATEEWLDNAVNDASLAYFNKPAVNMGEGGSIPFMGMLGNKYPEAQFVITGVLGPKSNAHGPNEFLHIPMGKKLTACVSSIIYDHYRRCVLQRRFAEDE